MNFNAALYGLSEEYYSHSQPLDWLLQELNERLGFFEIRLHETHAKNPSDNKTNMAVKKKPWKKDLQNKLILRILIGLGILLLSYYIVKKIQDKESEDSY